MKALIVILAVWLFLILSSFAGGMPVIDAVAIANQRIAAQRDYLEQLLHEANQQTEIVKMVEQIRQLDSYLDRFGDPRSIKNLDGLDELYRQLKAAPVLKLPEVKREDIQPDEVFRPLASKIGPKLEKEIVLDGKVAATRDGEIYSSEVAERRTQEDYKQVRASVMTRRDELRQAMAGSLNQLQHAGTASEVQKLSAVVAGLAAELQATDHELQFAAGDVQARALANVTEKEILRKAAVERERETLRVSTKKDAALYRLYTAPIRFSESP